MEKDLSKETVKASIKKVLSKKEVNKIHPLILAWLGDSIFSNYVRRFLLLNKSVKIKKLHKISTNYVKAKAQADIIHHLMPILTEEEIEIVKKGRNTLSKNPKNSTVKDYRYATGFESLIGWLDLTGQKERTLELCSEGIDYIKKTAT